MSYSDYDSDGYSSNEDVDYVPSDDNLSEDDMKDCEKEDPLNEDDEVPHPGNSSKKKSKKKDVRKRKKCPLDLDKEEKKGGDEANEEEETTAPVGKNDDERQKKKSDDLWASFLSDMGSRPKASSEASQPVCTETQPTSSSPSLPTPERPAKASPVPEKVVITKVFDFAGEQVKVEKEVCADSREAKAFLKITSEEKKVKESVCPGPSVKRTAGMSSILGQIGGKKPKMSTLEKSKMDWDAFKSEEGIGDELAIHNRGREGYVERKNFLERVDHRQFEREKSVRLSNMKQ